MNLLKKNNKILIFFFLFGLLQIYYLYSKRSNFDLNILFNPFKENSYLEKVLENPVLETKAILQAKKLDKFNLSKNLSNKDSYFYQRIIEYNYPIRLDENSEYTFFLKNEKNNCKEIYEGKFIDLKKCL